MRWFRGKGDSALNDVAGELKTLRDLLETQVRLQDQVAPPLASESDYVLRLESLEGRFEELRGQCLRHLQSASQRLKLAERKEEELEDAGELPAPFNGNQMQLPVEEVEEAVSDLDWARRQLLSVGETPVTGV
jgi:hypothetical protein